MVWKRPTERYGYGTLKCDASDVNAFKRMAGIDEWGARTHLCVPIGAHMGTPQKGKIHDETKRGLDRGLVSVLHSSTVHEHERYLFDQQSSFFPFQRRWAADVQYNNKVQAFLSCTNPAETGRTREVRHVSIRSKRNKQDREERKMKLLYCIARYRAEQSVLRYTMQFGRFEGLREAIQPIRPKLPSSGNHAGRKECHACECGGDVV